jgi:3-hydroxy-9,10-secoandrosta-1,3,5(10)-triene-9,17-dione monooxygenase
MPVASSDLHDHAAPKGAGVTTPNTAPAVAPPEPDLTPDELIERAVELRPKLHERQEETERLGHYPESTLRDFQEAGFYRVWVPRALGGYEFDVPTFARLIVEVGRGCPSTAWALALQVGHQLTIGAYWSEQAQREIFGAHNGEFRSGHRDMPSGFATPTDDGYLIRGLWRYVSGNAFPTHFIGNLIVQDEKPGAVAGTATDGAGDYDENTARFAMVCLPIEDVEVLDDWGNILGMQGSASNSVRVADAFVPEHYLVELSEGQLIKADADARVQGQRLWGNPMYSGRLFTTYNLEIIATVVGTLLACRDDYEQNMRTRKAIFPPRIIRKDHPEYLRKFGKALLKSEAMQLLLLKVAEEQKELTRLEMEEGVPFTDEQDLLLGGILQEIGDVCWKTGGDILRAAGSSAVKDGQRMQRYFRDLSTYSVHQLAQIDSTAWMHGASYFGDPKPWGHDAF